MAFNISFREHRSSDETTTAKNVITVMTEDGKKDYEVNKDTKFIGPKGAVSAKGIEDDRLKEGVEVTLKVAGNNRTLHEVHIPVIKSKD